MSRRRRGRLGVARGWRRTRAPRPARPCRRRRRSPAARRPTASKSAVGSPSCSITATGRRPRSRTIRATSSTGGIVAAHALPTPITTVGLEALDIDAEEVRGAGDAGRSCGSPARSAAAAPPRGVDHLLHDTEQVLLDRLLVLRGGRDDLRVQDLAVVVERVAVVQHAARCLGPPVSRRGAWLERDRWPVGRS